jgi:anaphase-promoting complex subunit 2
VNSVDSVADRWKVEYEAFKASRKLRWKPHLGSVQLELELDAGADARRSLSLTVSPVHASLILYFTEQRTSVFAHESGNGEWSARS